MITVIPTNRCSDIDIYINVNNRLKQCKWGRERHLTYLYASEKGFHDVSFQLWPGEVLGIVGEWF
ncbi:hypothetical protein BV921_05690 [Pectobacterium odoriferum]|uniref:Uncharacterized protein n=1 Tax=Pectobacterium odoriferum TaxID=78398 RepID=A0ABD6VUT4_9GAMM|nr:hypothetical protein BVY06_06545 [Pectobacterium odoriferum]POE11859.1 hypothetical protein BV921_05690 [Pectobacterium odoriferum]POE15493.1 hypothetical protein BV924_01585 [Pectobacterium odoriferum]POE23927.1 hypothetical protein BV923_03855 [Pectobacterium odoriferum]POE29032.1 hypothetical protein BV926_01580 [Pectobacterium odoriferum]